MQSKAAAMAALRYREAIYEKEITDCSVIDCFRYAVNSICNQRIGGSLCSGW